MKILPKLALAAAAALLCASCCPCRSYQKKTRRPLEGTEWQLIQLGGKSVRPEEGTFSLQFDAEKQTVSGTGACNRLSGNYTTGERRALSIGPLASTRMTCPDMDRERDYTEALEATTHYDMDGPMLLLLSNGELRAVFQAQPAPTAQKR